jgi:hypothetical protein
MSPKKKEEPTVETNLPAGFEMDEDGIVSLDPVMVTDIEEVPSDHFGHFFSIKTGKKLQGGGVRTDYSYYIVPYDIPEQKKDIIVNQLKFDGWVRVDGVRCQDLNGIILRRPQRLQEQARNRRRAMNDIADNRRTEIDSADFRGQFNGRNDSAESTLKTSPETMTVREALTQ